MLVINFYIITIVLYTDIVNAFYVFCNTLKSLFCWSFESDNFLHILNRHSDSGNWVVFQPNYIIDARLGCLWRVNLIPSGLAHSVSTKKILYFQVIKTTFL